MKVYHCSAHGGGLPFGQEDVNEEICPASVVALDGMGEILIQLDEGKTLEKSTEVIHSALQVPYRHRYI